MTLLGRREFLIGGAGAAVFAECVDRERQLGTPSIYRQALAGLSGEAEWQPTFAFRLGWPTRPGAASPRRSLASVVMPPYRTDS
jgi:hypothetical protein